MLWIVRQAIVAGRGATGRQDGGHGRFTLREPQKVTQGSGSGAILILGRAQTTAVAWPGSLATAAVTSGHQTDAAGTATTLRLRLPDCTGGGHRP
ncbi:MAG: hypothetical protein WBG67_03835 [Thermoanaerobaculia bacterium]